VIYKKLLVIILLACSSYVAGAAYSKPQKPARRTVVVDVPERTQDAFILKSDTNRVMTPMEWKKLALALEEVKKLKVGMTRGDVLKDFCPLSNEIYSIGDRRYFFKAYPDLVVALRFQTTGPGDSSRVRIDPELIHRFDAYKLADYSGYVIDVVTKISLYYTGPALEKRHIVVL
jgi:hypothetical protein